MKIVHDENIPLAAEFFAPLGELHPCDGRTLSPAQVATADILLVRSVTPVGRELLRGSRVGFVASATIGTDHIDRCWLSAEGIPFANAPGCNAESVVDYVFAALLRLADGDWQQLARRRIGVVGVGNVGRRLVARLNGLGLSCLRCDPPREQREGGDFVALDELLARCDVVCLHTPLTVDGAHPTHHLLDAERLACLLPQCWLINAGRGAVVDNRALGQLLPTRPDLRTVLDVWEPEPSVDADLVPRVSIATPHIAGYSLEGRCRGTEMIYRALCNHLGIAPQQSLAALLPPAPRLDLRGVTNGLPAAAVAACYAIGADDARFRAMVAANELPTGFDRLRKDYPGRREFASCRIDAVAPGAADAAVLRGLGFRLDEG